MILVPIKSITISLRLMLNDFIDDAEFLYKRIPSNPNNWKDGRITSAVFKDSRGLSVDRQHTREDENVVKFLKESFSNIVAIAKVKAEVCREVATYPVYKPVEGNIFHSEIHDSVDKVVISGAKAKKLSTLASVSRLNEE